MDHENQQEENIENEVEAGEEIVPEEDLPENILPKLKKLREELKQCQSEKQEYLAGSQRLKADYVNLKRQEALAREEFLKFAEADLVTELLAVVDDFELAFLNKELWQKVDETWRQGMEQIYAKLRSFLNRREVIEVGAPGEPFNPDRHQAVGTIAVSDPAEDQVVKEVVKKGYRFRERLLRPAQVRIGHYDIM